MSSSKISINYGDKIILHKDSKPCVTNVAYIDKKFLGLAHISSIQNQSTTHVRNGLILNHETGPIRVKIKFYTPKTLKNFSDYCVITKTIGTNELKNVFIFPPNETFNIGGSVGVVINNMFFKLKLIISENTINNYTSSEINFLGKKLILNASIVE